MCVPKGQGFPDIRHISNEKIFFEMVRFLNHLLDLLQPFLYRFYLKLK